MTQEALVRAIADLLSAAGVDLTDTTCQLIETFVSQVLAQ